MMKTYQTPELVWQMISADDIITTSPYLVDGAGEDEENLVEWW